MKYTIVKSILFLFLLALLSAVFVGCKKGGIVKDGKLPPWTVQCQAKAVIYSTCDTILIEDLDTYHNSNKTPEYYEDWYGIKTYHNGQGYSFYECWIK